MTPIRACSALMLLLYLLAASSASGTSGSLADPAVFIRQVRDAIRLDSALQKNFTYIEQRRDVKVSKLGKLSVGPLRTFEVYPANVPGRTYKRLIAIDGKPLDPVELARRDEQHRTDLEEMIERERSERWAGRPNADADAQRERDAILNDAVAVFSPAFIGRETIEGQPLVVVALTPRADVRVSTPEGRWMKHLEGRMWVSEADHQIAAIDLRALDDVTIGWGVIARFHEGSRLIFKRRRFEDVWLPAEMTFEGTGRTLLFRKFQIKTIVTYSDYKKLPAGTANTAGDR